MNYSINLTTAQSLSTKMNAIVHSAPTAYYSFVEDFKRSITKVDFTEFLKVDFMSS